MPMLKIFSLVAASFLMSASLADAKDVIEHVLETRADYRGAAQKVGEWEAKVSVAGRSGLVDQATYDDIVARYYEQVTALEASRIRHASALEELSFLYRNNTERLEADILARIELLKNNERQDTAYDLLEILEKVRDGEVRLKERFSPSIKTNSDVTIPVIQEYLITYAGRIALKEITGQLDQATLQSIPKGVDSVVKYLWDDSSTGFYGVLTPELYLDIIHENNLRFQDKSVETQLIDSNSFINSVWQLRSQGQYLPEPYKVTAERLLSVFYQTPSDGVWDVGDIGSLIDFINYLQRDPLYGGIIFSSLDDYDSLLAVELSNEIASFVEGSGDYTVEQKKLYALYFYFFEALNASLEGIIPVINDYYKIVAIRDIQSLTKRHFDIPELAVGDDWGVYTNAGLYFYIEALKSTPELGWEGAVDGYYTQDFDGFLELYLSQHDPSGSIYAEIELFWVSMDILIEHGVYSLNSHEALWNEYIAIKSAPPENFFLPAALMIFANGYTNELGDEILWWLNGWLNGPERAAEFRAYSREILEYTAINFTILTMVISSIGRMLSIPGVFFAIWVGHRFQKKRLKAFFGGLVFELGEAFAAYLFESWTYAELQPLTWVYLFMAILAGVGTGIGAVLVTNLPMSHEERYKWVSGREAIIGLIALSSCVLVFVA